MKFGEKIVEGIFLERPNRYLARVEVDGKEALAHVPDPGRLHSYQSLGQLIRENDLTKWKEHTTVFTLS